MASSLPEPALLQIFNDASWRDSEGEVGPFGPGVVAVRARRLSDTR
jgi:hypothetical protein